MQKLAILVTRLSSWVLSKMGRGGSMPGRLGIKIAPDCLNHLKFGGPVILVTGTNGKTSTANMVSDLMEEAGYKVVTNRKGDNLRVGITSTLLSHCSLSGRVKADAAVLEVDELNMKYIVPALPVTAIVVNNFFRDQLDRAGEMERIIDTIESVLPDYQGDLILNGNDPNVVRLAMAAPNARKIYFGAAKNPSTVEHSAEAAEGKFCPKCGSRLEYDFYQYSHIGQFHCSSCDFATPKLDVCPDEIDLDAHTFRYDGHVYPMASDGLYSLYNCAAVLAAARSAGVDPKLAEEVFARAERPAGRNERFEKAGRDCILNLVKNPTGANEVMKVIEKDPAKKTIVIVLNDNAQDGRDISWIYDTVFEKLMDDSTEEIICTGTRAWDMALRIYYGGFTGKIRPEESMEAAVHEALQAPHVYAVATYTALLPTRNTIVKEMGL